MVPEVFVEPAQVLIYITSSLSVTDGGSPFDPMHSEIFSDMLIYKITSLEK